MSLPPLVCNTPPPPDQCDDDNDHEDYDINYNLSQDDNEDSNGYDYQTYGNYNIYETSKSDTMESNWSLTVNNISESVQIENEKKENKETDSVTPIIKDFSQKLTVDDIAVEDLNLEISHEQINCQVINTEKIDPIITSDNDYSLGETNTCIDRKISVADSDIPEIDNAMNKNENAGISVISPSEIIQSLNYPAPTSKTFEEPDEDFDDFNSNLNPINNERDGQRDKNQEQSIDEFKYEGELEDLKNTTQNTDDFGDFDDFQFVNDNSNVTTVVENFENPWLNEDPQTSDDIGHFEANFDESNNHSNLNNVSSQFVRHDEGNRLESEISKDLEDEFGDFDDFKSCKKQQYINNDQREEVQYTEKISAMDFNTPDNESQILESISGVFTSIFEEELLESDKVHVGRLESVLNETWGHLVDIDIRQPYMLNWNNSLGQKSLLKALCIDSRNILFGPKWNYNMPKYAVNLCAAPLQPQKQITSPLSQMDIQNIDKPTTNKIDTWTDPFSSNGQEFTYAEALLLDLEHLMATLDQMAHKHTSLKISELLSHACHNGNDTAAAKRTSANLEETEKDISSKIDKLYPTTINVQPLRQISLPDTHIFTPSDSETPRSKTIHYDNASPVVLPQSITDDQSSNLQLPASEIVHKIEEENAYWEFQDYKTTAEIIHTTENKVEWDKPEIKSELNSEEVNVITPNVCTPHETQLLQPIKVEPLIPTLNWPNPGEVKETFDDFSDFISNSSYQNSKDDVTKSDTHNLAPVVKTLALDKNNDPSYHATTFNGEISDDDFEIFQSAPPKPKSNNVKTAEDSTSELNCQSCSKVESFGIFSEYDKFASNESKSDDSIKMSVPEFTPEVLNSSRSSVNDDLVVNSPVNSAAVLTVLKPTILSASSNNTSRKQNNSGQILQPLSLEGYSQINWPNPGIDLQDLSRFNPVETLPSLKGDSSTSGQSKGNSPAHNERTSGRTEVLDDDIWGDFVSSKPKQQMPTVKKLQIFGDEEEWTEFVSSSTVKPQNGLNTISLNVHTNLNLKKSSNLNKLNTKHNQISLDIPTLNYITPKSSNKTYDEKHFQNL